MPPFWLTVLSWIALGLGFASAGWIAFDIYGRRYRQPMGVMEAVWPITALYFGPVAVWGYHRFGRTASPRWRADNTDRPQPAMPRWASTAMEVSHCGAGCTLGDIIAEFAVFGLGLTIAGSTLYAEFVGDYLVAIALGIVFQYFAIAPMRGLSFRRGIVEAAKADIVSLTAFEIGLFGWMAVMAFVIFPDVPVNDPVHWFGMQIGMIIGYFTSWPANVWLLRKGIKEEMSHHHG